MPLLHSRGQFLFQVKPSLFPEGEWTVTEALLWEKFYIERNNERNKNG